MTLACFALSLALSSCGEEPAIEAGPGIWVILDAEPALRSELDRLELQTSRGSATVWLGDPPSGSEQASLPLLLDLSWDAQRATDTLQVSGYAADDLRVERAAQLSFPANERRVLRILLTEACARRVNDCDADDGLTCVNCGGTCESAVVPLAALERVSAARDPRTSYAAEACSSDDAGMDASVDGADMDGSVDAGDAASDAADDASIDDAGMDGSTTELDASGDASLDAAADAGADASDDASTGDPLLQSCVLLMHMNESQWDGTSGEVIDDSGLGNDGTSAGSALTTASGYFGRAGQLDGGGWVAVADAPSLRASSALTVSAWFYLDELPGDRWPGIVAKRAGFGSETAFALFLSPENLVYLDVAGEESRFTSVTTIQAQRWYHVAFVFDGTLPMTERSKLYIDGVLDATHADADSVIPAYTSPLMIGNLVGGGQTFVGRIDEVAIWTRALSSSEIASLGAASDEL